MGSPSMGVKSWWSISYHHGMLFFPIPTVNLPNSSEGQNATIPTAANVDDAQAASQLFGRLEGQPMSKVVRMYADAKYHNFRLYQWVEENARWELSIVRRPE